MQSARILVVATTEATQRLYSDLFRPYTDEGLTLQFALSGVAALERLRKESEPALRANLLIIPAELPILSPFAFVRSVRQDSHLQSIPIVVFTYGLRDDELSRLYSEGVNTVIQLPHTLAEMEGMIQSFALLWLRFAYLPYPGNLGNEAWNHRP